MAKETAVPNEIGQQKRPESPAERRQRLDKSLEVGLEQTFPASDAVSIVQPPPTAYDRGKTAGGT